MERKKQFVSKYVDNTEEITSDCAPLKPDERREYPRRAARWAATMLTQDKSLVHGRSLNVSERGASLASPCNFAIGTMLILELQIIYKSLRKSIRLMGEVRHTSIAGTGFTIGILFKEISDPAQDFLKKYAEERI